MPRGGRRENAGKKSQWESGRSISETKVIRVPVEFADKLLEIAHKLDAGESFESETKSKEESQTVEHLTEQVEKLREQIVELELQTSRSLLIKKRDRVLRGLKLGTSAPQYKLAVKVLNGFIESLVGVEKTE